MKNNVKNALCKGMTKISAFLLLAESRANYLIHCDAFDDATKASTNLATKLSSLAEILFPLAIIICAISMFFTRDQKKFDMEKHILIGCCLAFLLILIVNKGGFTNMVTTIKNLLA